MSVLGQRLVTWEELIAADAVIDAPGEDEMTPAAYAKETGLSVSRASTKLKERFERGELTRRKLRNHGWAYRVKA